MSRSAPVATRDVRLRPALAGDLDALNAVMTWQLAERVKRLSLPSYRYHAHDLEHLQIVVAEDADGTIVGVAAWGDANSRDVPGGGRALLLHGLYVDPARQRAGIGSALLDAAAADTQGRGYDGLLVKAQADAAGFFAARRMRRLPVRDPARDYPHRYWLAVPPRHPLTISIICLGYFHFTNASGCRSMTPRSTFSSRRGG